MRALLQVPVLASAPGVATNDACISAGQVSVARRYSSLQAASPDAEAQYSAHGRAGTQRAGLARRGGGSMEK